MASREPPKWVKKSNKWFKKKAQKAREAFANIGGKRRSGDDDDDLDDTDYQPIASTRNEGNLLHLFFFFCFPSRSFRFVSFILMPSPQCCFGLTF